MLKKLTGGGLYFKVRRYDKAMSKSEPTGMKYFLLAYNLIVTKRELENSKND